MRRVYDDAMINEAVNLITGIMNDITFNDVSEYSYGTDRVSVYKIKSLVADKIKPTYKFGNTTHAHGIGNNNAIEIIYTGNPNEEQICGLLHLNSGLYGDAYAYITDIDDNTIKRFGELSYFKRHWYVKEKED